MPRVIVSPMAESDALDVWTYIARDNPSAADRLLNRINRVFHELAIQPNMGRNAEEMFPHLRMFPVGNYLIFYRPQADGIEVVRLLHGARDITADLFRE